MINAEISGWAGLAGDAGGHRIGLHCHACPRLLHVQEAYHADSHGTVVIDIDIDNALSMLAPPLCLDPPKHILELI